MSELGTETSSRCEVCGEVLPPDAPRGLCPKCLAAAATGSTPNRDGKSAVRTVRYFGDYELLGEIASGGMGKVYLARQISLKRTIALKMIRSGELATAAEVQRFRTEAEAAASLDHPNIVPIYEIGEHEGQYYFSMKLIEGGHLGELNATCTVRDATWLRRAVQLIATIARAVHHAHQRGVLHRDIKPTNILLDEQGEPHLTDFGLAKLAQTGRDLTQTIAMLGTPHYMAPEQATGKAREVTVAADIYGLGAVLFELLTGRTVFQGESALEVLKQAQERDAPFPHKLNLAVRRDLETVCLKCLEKEPQRRYDTAEDLAHDLDRWLAGEPIQARPVGAPERVWKWAQRNPVVATLVVVAHVLFVAGIIGVLWQWRRAEAEAGRATVSARQAEANEKAAELEAVRSAQVAQFMKDMLDSVGPGVALGRDTTLLREILDKTAERVGRELQGQPEIEAEIRSTLGKTYLKLGEYGKAELMLREALHLRESLFGETNELTASSLNDLARALVSQVGRKPTESESLARRALAVRRHLFGQEHVEVALSYYVLASALFWQGRYAEAEAMYRQTVLMRKKLLGNEHSEVASSLDNLALTLSAQGRPAEAETALREALQGQRKTLGEVHPDVANTLGLLALVLEAQDKLAEAEQFAREATVMRMKVIPNHWHTAQAMDHLARILERRGKPAEADEWYNMAGETGHAQVLSDMAWRLATSDSPSPARKTKAVTWAEKAVTATSRTNADYLATLAAAYAQNGQFTNAVGVQREAIALLENEAEMRIYAARLKLYESNSPYRDHGELAKRTLVLLVAGKFVEAEALARQCLALREMQIPDDWRTSNARSMLGGSLLGQEKYVEAEPLLLSGYEGMRQREKNSPAVPLVRLQEAVQRLATLYAETDRPDEAAKWQQMLKEFPAEEAK